MQRTPSIDPQGDHTFWLEPKALWVSIPTDRVFSDHVTTPPHRFPGWKTVPRSLTAHGG